MPGRTPRRALLDHVWEMVSVSDRRGGIGVDDPATERVCGYGPEEFVERHPFDTIHPEDRPRCEESEGRDDGVDGGPSAGVGLRSMRERKQMPGGRLEISSNPGRGTAVDVKVPLTD